MRSPWLLRSLLVPCTVGLILLSACTSDDPIPPAVTVDELAGTWLTGCQPESSSTGVGSRLTAVSLSGGTITFHEYEFNGSDDCDGGPSRFQRNVGTIAYAGSNSTTTFGNAAKMDLTATLSEITLLDDALVTEYNSSNGGAGAYGYNGWTRGVARNVTNIGYSGAPEPSVMKTLMMRSGETLFVGDDNSTPDSAGYPTQVRPEVSRVTDTAVTAAAMTGEWVGTCRQEDKPDYSAGNGAALEWVTITATTVTINTTYYSTTYCGWSESQGALGAAEVREQTTFNYTVSGTTNLLTERGLATGIDLTLTALVVTPLSGGAVSVLVNANVGAGAFAYTGWVNGTPYNVTAGTNVDYDGVTALQTQMKVAALVRGDRFYARGGDPFTNIPYQSPGGVGYPLTVGTEPLLRNHFVTAIADLNGNWFEACRDRGGADYRTSAIIVGSGQLYRREWTYANGSTNCSGAASQVENFLWNHTVQATNVPTAHGTAVELSLQDPGATADTTCVVLIRAGDRIYASANTLTGNTGPCTTASGDYRPDVGDEFSTRQITPLTAVPFGTYRGTCRNDNPGVSNDWREYLSFHSAGMVIDTVNFTSTAGLCNGTVSGQDSAAATLALGGTVSVTEGTATQVSAVDELGATMNQIVMWMGDLVWSGDDQGVPAGSYPTLMKPGDDLIRIY
jgi:hypothetical protein